MGRAGSINFDSVSGADFYWVLFSSYALRASEDEPSVAHGAKESEPREARSAKQGEPCEAPSAKQGYGETLPSLSTVTCMGLSPRLAVPCH